MSIFSHSSREPHGRADAVHVVQLLERLRLTWLLAHLPAKLVWALYVLLNGFITIAVLAFVAAVTDSPFVFPSLGPTAFLFFFNPLAESSSPHNTLCGHAIGLACGYGAYAITGMRDFPQSFSRPSLLAAHSVSSSVAFDNRGADGASARESSACRSHYNDRFSWNPFPALVPAGDRGSRRSADGTSLRD
jgi:HPP family